MKDTRYSKDICIALIGGPVRLAALFVVAASLTVLAAPKGAIAAAADGQKVFDARKCAACHQISGPAKEKTIQDQLKKKGPELWYAGNKFRPAFLEAWLKDPKPIRPMAYYSIRDKNPGDHPKLSSREAADVAAYLMGLKYPGMKSAGIQAADNVPGRVVFLKKQSCYGCHQVRVRGTLAGGLSGPAFSNAAARLNPDWIYAYLSDSKTYKPVKDMPEYSGILTDDEMRSVAAYIGSLE